MKGPPGEDGDEQDQMGCSSEYLDGGIDNPVRGGFDSSFEMVTSGSGGELTLELVGFQAA